MSNNEDHIENTGAVRDNNVPIADTEYTVLVERLTGIVKWFNNRAGFGFITVCEPGDYENKEIFVHWSSIRVSNSQYKYLFQGEYVDFTLVKANNNNHEYQAMNVSGVKGGPIMCEIRSNSTASNGSGGRGVRRTGGGGDRVPRRTDSYRNTVSGDRPPRTPRVPRDKTDTPAQGAELLDYVKVQSKRTRKSAAR